MKKFISMILAIVMIACVFAVPCAADVNVDFSVNVSFDYATRTVSFEGDVSTAYGSKSITYYLLYPGKVQDDVANDIASDPVVSYYGQKKVDVSGHFSESFRYSGEEGVYTLFITSGNVLKAFSIDTSKDMDSATSLQLAGLYRLPSSFAPISADLSVRDSFFTHKNEIPSEMPVVRPRAVDGHYTIYVDVQNGNDETATGSIDAPYKTIKEAVKDFKPTGGMVLCLREGNYPASDAINLSNIKATEALPFFVTSIEGEEVNIIGGTDIASENFENVTDADVLSRLNPSVVDKVLVADLSAMGVKDFGAITSSSSPVLFVGGSKYTIARWPNVELTGMMHVRDALGEEMAAQYEDLNPGYTQSRGTGVIDCGVITTSMGSPCGNYRRYSKRATELNNAAGEVVSTDTGAEFCVEDIRPFSWVNTGNIWMYVSLHDEWTHDHTKVAEFNPETRSVRTKTSNGWGTQYKAVNKFYYYNVLEELDSPGEWFVDDATGKLYIYPASDITKEKVMFAPSSTTMWTLNNCENVIVNGINFTNARGQALEVKGSDTKNVVVQNCKFSDVGSGVTIEGRYSGVINSEFTSVAGNSIVLKGGSSTESVNLIPGRQFAQNNKVYNSKGITTTGVGNIVSHNYLSNVIGSCLYFSASRETVLEYNEVVAGPRETLDSGAIYLNGNQQFNRGNHVRYNYIHETGHSIGSSIPQSIYFDDMASENYAYGNVLVGGRMLFHNGSEISVYNNLIISTPGTYQPVNVSPNYYNQAISTSSSPSPRWRQGALEYGTFTSSLKPGNAYNNGDGTIAEAYASRYPKLATWATLMYQRIEEYQTLKKTMSAVKASQSGNCSLESPVSGVKLNSYLAASRENHFENNVFIDAPSNTNITKYGFIKGDNVAGEGQGHYEEKKIFGITYSKEWVWDVTPVTEAGHINPYVANNVSMSNPFSGSDYGNEAAYDTIRKTVSSFETIPYAKIGLTDEADYAANEKTVAITPVHSAEATVNPKSVSLKWKAITGAQMYKVQIAEDANFNNIIEEKTSFEMAHQVSCELDADTIYYWRVITTPIAKNATGSEMTSDTFMFKTITAIEASDFNQFGVTDYAVVDVDGNVLSAIPEDGKFYVSGYAYNLTGSDQNANIHIACYDAEGNLIAVKSAIVDAAGVTVGKGTFSGKFTTAEFNAPGTKDIKIFTWSADGNMVPYSFVKTIK